MSKLTFDEIFAKIERDNRAAESRVPVPSAKEAAKLATFLANWSKGRKIVRQGSGATFWRCGKFITQISASQVRGLVAAGYATCVGDPEIGGAMLIVRKEKQS